ILMVSGIFIIMGFYKTYRLLFTFEKLKGTLCFLLGFVLVILKWSFIGMVLELIGIFLLFGHIISYFKISGFIPIMLSFMNKIPVLGWIIDYLTTNNIFPSYFRKSIV
ncbi:hypothetical protein MXB_564, partial [Myxobolus squamalis]